MEAQIPLQEPQQEEDLKKLLERYFEENSESFKSYIEELKNAVKRTNSKAMCVLCWCKLDKRQRDAHPDGHKDQVKTPIQ